MLFPASTNRYISSIDFNHAGEKRAAESQQQGNKCRKMSDVKEKQLWNAIHESNHSLVKQCIREKANVDFSCEENEMCAPLHLASKTENVGILKSLLEACPDLEKKNRFGETPLAVAANAGNHRTVRCLLLSGGNINAQDNFGRTALFRASFSDHEEIVRYLLMCGAKKDTKNNEGFSALGVAKSSKTIAVFEDFKMKGSFLNQAIVNRKFDIAVILIFQGARSEVENTFEVLRKIVEYVEDLDQDISKVIVSKAKCTNMNSIQAEKISNILLLACKHNHDETILNINNHFVANSIKYNGNNLLHHGVLKKSMDIMEKASGMCNMKDRNSEGKSVLQLAAEIGNQEIIQFVRGKIGTIEDKDHRGNNLLHLSVIASNMEVVKYLSSQINITAKNKDGNTPLHLSALCKDENIVRVLLLNGASSSHFTENRKGEIPLELSKSKDTFRTIMLNFLSTFDISVIPENKLKDKLGYGANSFCLKPVFKNKTLLQYIVDMEMLK